MNSIILGIILAFLPISELRGGLLAAIPHAINNNIPVMPVFLIIVFVNILSIFFVFFFLDFLHKKFIKLSFYKNSFDFYMEKIRKKIDNFENKFGTYGFLALIIFVAIPLPATGSWTGSLIAWYLDLDRKKSIISIALGVLIAGIIVLFSILGFFKLI